MYCYQSPSATVDFRPGRFVAIDSDIDRKLAAVGAFAARAPARGYLDEDMIRSTARYWSRFGDTGYAEAFEVIRESGALSARPAPDHTAVPARGSAPPEPLAGLRAPRLRRVALGPGGLG